MIWLYGIWLACVSWASFWGTADWGYKIWGIAPQNGTPGLMSSVLCGVLHVGASRLKDWKWVWQGFALFWGLVAAAALVEWRGGRLFWPFSDSDQAGLWGLLGVFIALRAGERYIGVLCGIMMVLSQSRGAFCGLLGGLALMWGPKRFLVGLGGFATLLWWRGLTDSEWERLGLAKRALQGIWLRPWGWGYAGWTWINMQATPSGVRMEVNDRAHNVVLDWALLGGILGAIALIAMWGLAFKILLKNDRKVAALLLAMGFALFWMFPTWEGDLVFVLVCGYAAGRAIGKTPLWMEDGTPSKRVIAPAVAGVVCARTNG